MASEKWFGLWGGKTKPVPWKPNGPAPFSAEATVLLRQQPGKQLSGTTGREEMNWRVQNPLRQALWPAVRNTPLHLESDLQRLSLVCCHKFKKANSVTGVRTPRRVMNLGFQGLSQLLKRAELSATVIVSTCTLIPLKTHPKNDVTFSSVKHIYLKKNLSYEVKCELRSFWNRPNICHVLTQGFGAQLTLKLPQCCAPASSCRTLLWSYRVLDLNCNVSCSTVSSAKDILLEFHVQAKC